MCVHVWNATIATPYHEGNITVGIIIDEKMLMGWEIGKQKFSLNYVYSMEVIKYCMLVLNENGNKFRFVHSNR